MVKRREVVDVVCAAVIGRIERPEYVVVGLPVEGQLRIVGRSTALSAKESRELTAYLETHKSAHPWPEVITETTLNRFSKGKGQMTVTLVEPLVVESQRILPGPGMPFVIPAGICVRGLSWYRRKCSCRAVANSGQASSSSVTKVSSGTAITVS